MKAVYKCDVCHKTHDDESKANVCETTHTIIKPNAYWLIPLVAWFVVPYKLFTQKNAILVFDTEKSFWLSLRSDLIQWWIIVGPILLLLFSMSLCNKN